MVAARGDRNPRPTSMVFTTKLTVSLNVGNEAEDLSELHHAEDVLPDSGQSEAGSKVPESFWIILCGREASFWRVSVEFSGCAEARVRRVCREVFFLGTESSVSGEFSGTLAVRPEYVD